MKKYHDAKKTDINIKRIIENLRDFLPPGYEKISFDDKFDHLQKIINVVNQYVKNNINKDEMKDEIYNLGIKFGFLTLNGSSILKKNINRKLKTNDDNIETAIDKITVDVYEMIKTNIQNKLIEEIPFLKGANKVNYNTDQVKLLINYLSNLDERFNDFKDRNINHNLRNKLTTYIYNPEHRDSSLIKEEIIFSDGDDSDDSDDGISENDFFPVIGALKALQKEDSRDDNDYKDIDKTFALFPKEMKKKYNKYAGDLNLNELKSDIIDHIGVWIGDMDWGVNHDDKAMIKNAMQYLSFIGFANDFNRIASKKPAKTWWPKLKKTIQDRLNNEKKNSNLKLLNKVSMKIVD